MAKTINCVELLAIAYAAYRQNGNELLRDSVKDRVANGVLVKEFAQHGKPTVTVTDEDRTQARAIRDYITQRVMLSKLTGKQLSEFIYKISSIISEEQTSAINAGLIAWAPKIFVDLQKSDEAQQEFSMLGISSVYIGAVGSKVELEFHTITKRWTNHYACFRYTGHDGNGNLVGFLSKHDYPAVVRLKARIKAHETGKLTGGKTTYINYTKAI